VDGRVVVERVISTEVRDDLGEVKRGDVILFVDGQEIEQRLEDILSLTCYNSAGWGRLQAAKNVLRFVDVQTEHTEVVLAKKTGEILVARIPLLPGNHAAFSAHRRKIRMDEMRGCIEVSYIEDIQAGHLAYRSCVDRSKCDDAWRASLLKELGLKPDDIPDMEETCWKLFHELSRRSYHRLILDLRGNQGGSSDIGQVLLKYLTKKKLRTYDADIKISRRLQSVNEGYQSEEPDTVRKHRDMSLEFPYNSRLDEEQLSALRQFSGELFVLIDTEVFSSGEWLSAELRANGLGIFIGEPTGGGGSVPGDQIRFELPNTKLSLGISHKFFYQPETEDMHYLSVIPHYWIKPSLHDFRSGRDTVLEFVRGMAK
jgi:hypothetical protein